MKMHLRSNEDFRKIKWKCRSFLNNLTHEIGSFGEVDRELFSDGILWQ